MLEEDCMLIKCIHFVVCFCFTLVTGRLSLGLERRRENRAADLCSVDGIFEAWQRCYIQPLTFDLEGKGVMRAHGGGGGRRLLHFISSKFFQYL